MPELPATPHADQPHHAHARHRSTLAARWTLDPAVTFLNHGSFGATPAAVLEHQSLLRAQLESEPVRFLVERLEPLLDHARQQLAHFLNADPLGLVFVPNATHGVNTVLNALTFNPGDELLTTNHAYNACRCALEVAAHRSHATVTTARIPFPIQHPDHAANAILSAVTPRTRLVLLDHVTSPTALVLPIEQLVHQLNDRGIITLIDGAHAPGMIDLDLNSLNPSAYTGNCHKWIAAPKGAGFLWLNHELRQRVKPLAISHGHNTTRNDRPRLHLEFDWTGTADPTPYLAIPAALHAMASTHPDGWPGVRHANRALALHARDIITSALNIQHPAPDSMIGSIATIPLPPPPPNETPGHWYPHTLQRTLIDRWSIQVPIICWPHWPARLIRVSAQRYNHPSDYEYLAHALIHELANERTHHQPLHHPHQPARP